jgi:hypothetical protein
MDSAGQANGEKRVRAILIDGLMQRGLAKPGSLTKDQFQAMVDGLCAKLAYMSDINLAALEEEVAANPGGRDKDRFPIANDILSRAGRIQPPADDASPLIRAVFAAQLGRDALIAGWAPELLADLRQNRRWPGSYVVGQIKDQARDAIRKLEEYDRVLVRGDDLRPEEARWRDHRRAALARCQAIADMVGVRV